MTGRKNEHRKSFSVVAHVLDELRTLTELDPETAAVLAF
jgi:hypothetical protein